MFGVESRAAVVALAEDVECGQHVEDEDGGPAEEEEDHDQDQHVDHLLRLFLSTHNFVVWRDLTRWGSRDFLRFRILLRRVFIEMEVKINVGGEMWDKM